MQTNIYRSIELFFLFVGIPISFALEFPIWIKMIISLLGFSYVVFVLLRIEKNQFKISDSLNWKQFWKRTLLKLIVIAIVTTLYMWIFDSSNLYNVIRNKPMLWVVILFIYSLFSVYPQELIYRTFFFQRYKALFKSELLFMLINAALFSLAHLFFRNALVMIFTFIGGVLFALTYKKTKSTLLVSIEHAIYGCWLFTVGMGEMLGFPQ
jgi:membrane protease YdiL (CAAX protease family)